MKRAVFIFLLGCALAFSASAARASQPECHCEQYEHLLGFDLLGSDLGSITSMNWPGTGNILSNAALSNVPKECRDWLRKRHRASLKMRVTSTGPTAYQASSAEPDRLLKGYNDLVNGLVRSCVRATPKTDASEAAYRLCMEEEGRRTYGEFSSYFKNASTQEILDDAAMLSANPLAGFSASDITLLKTYHNVLTAGSAEDALKYLRKVSPFFSTEQKLSVVQMFGARFRQGYDDARNDALWNAPGSVSLDQLLAAAKNNTEVHFWGEDGFAIASADFEGVCRDIASGQGQMLEALGFRKTFVVSHAMLGGTYHVTTVTQDPTKDKVYRLDYGTRHDPAAGDSSALFAGGRDIALNYRVFKPGGKMVADVASDFGKFMSEAAGFDVRSLDPLARAKGSIAVADVALDRGGRFHLRAGIGTDGTGASYGFWGATASWGMGTNHEGRVALVAASQHRPGTFMGMKTDQDLDLFYVQVEQNLRTGALKITPNLQARIEARATAIFSMGRARQGNEVDKGAISGQGDLRVTVGARVDQKAWKKRFSATYQAGAQIVPGVKDIRNNYVPQTPIPIVNFLFASAEGRFQLSKTPEGRAYLVAAAQILWNELGPRFRAKAGFVRKSIGATVDIEGGDNPYEDGGEERYSGTLSWQKSSKTSLTFTGSTHFDDVAAEQAFEAMGGMTVRY